MTLVDPSDFVHVGENVVEVGIENGGIILAAFSKASEYKDQYSNTSKTSMLVQKTELPNFQKPGDFKNSWFIYEGIEYTATTAHSVGQDQFWRVNLKYA